MPLIATLGLGTPPAGGQGQSPQGNFLTMFAPLIFIFVIFYFLLIRPQQKQQKKAKEMLANIRKGDQIITRGGLYGKVTGIADNVLTVEIANNVQVKMTRDSVLQITPGS